MSRLRDPAWVRKEFWKLFKYGIVGLASTGIFLGIYALLSRIVWPSGNKTLLDGIAITASAVFNFTMHRVWTFKAGSYSAGMIGRYVVTVIGSSLVQTAMFHVGNEVLGFNDFLVQICLVPFIAMLSYVINRQFTFHRRYAGVAVPRPLPESVTVEGE